MAGDDLTEFAEIDVDSVHLVARSANGFPAPLLAKAYEALDEALEEQQTRTHHSPRPGPTERKQKMGKKALKKALDEAEAALAAYNGGADPATANAIFQRVGSPRPQMSLAAALSTMKAAAEQAEQRGDHATADGLRREILVTKMQVAERQREGRPSSSRLGPNTAELFPKGTGRLPEDTAVWGL